MEQRYTFIKTNEIKDDTMSEEERVEIEAVIEEHDMDALAEKLTNLSLIHISEPTRRM